MSLLDSPKNYLLVSKVTPFAVFILIIFGGYVKALGAGLACPDWPLCHNQIIHVAFYVIFSFLKLDYAILEKIM